MKVAIVGAGISGLAAGRTLQQAGVEAILFEKSRGVGGRVATRSRGGYVWDIGATSIAPRLKTIEQLFQSELNGPDLVEIERPIYTHSSLRIAPGRADRLGHRYTFRSGNQTLAKHLAKGLDIRFESVVPAIEREGTAFRVNGQAFDAVILTPPVPQTAALLWALGESRPIALATYRSCLSVNLGFDVPAPDVPYHAVIDADRDHPLTWLSLESLKSPDRAPEGHCALGAQLSPAFSLQHYRTSDEELIRIVVSFLQRLYGPQFAEPTASFIFRWKYSQPVGIADFREVNPPGSRVILAGDGLMGGHVEEAYESGVLAANLLVV